MTVYAVEAELRVPIKIEVLAESLEEAIAAAKKTPLEVFIDPHSDHSSRKWSQDHGPGRDTGHCIQITKIAAK